VCAKSPSAGDREVRYEHSRDFVPILQHEKISLLVSTYQAGKLVVLGTNASGLTMSYHNFEKATGIGVHARQLAIGTKSAIWILRSAPEVTAAVRAEGSCDACYLTRAAHFTDDIGIHEVQWCDDELWFVNTRFSCLCTLNDTFNFVPRWAPKFISKLAAEDRCHLNGLCISDALPRYVTALSETDAPGGWRSVKANGGCLIDVVTGETVARGFCMPHSPRLYGGRLWLLDSGEGRLLQVDPTTGARDIVTRQPGYLRGLDFAGHYAFIGLSRIRETSVFGGIPIAEKRDELKCAVVVVDLRNGNRVAYFEFLSGVEELFDVRVVPGVHNPLVSGPWAVAEGGEPIWYVPVKGSIATRLGTDSGNRIAPEPVAFTSIPAGMSMHAAVLLEKGLACASDDRFLEAVDCFEQAVRVDPDSAAVLSNLGLALQFAGRLDESLSFLERAVHIAPETPRYHMNLSATLFLLGRLPEAWDEYEWRWKCLEDPGDTAAFAALASPWNGSSMLRQTVLVFGEQGVDDEIMFASCYPDVLEQSQHCTFACDGRLAPLFRRSFPAAVVLPRDRATQSAIGHGVGPIDVQSAAGSLPRYLRTTRESFPRVDSFLQADERLVSRWRERYAELGPELKVGLSWRGGRVGDEQRRRSTTLDQLTGLFTVPGVKFINLQYGDCWNELASFRAQTGHQLHHWLDSDPTRDLDDLAAQIAALDLVISVDNSTVHLAGALGVPTMAMLSFPSASYWRWFFMGDETVWYRSVRLFRRCYPDTWDAVVRDVRAALMRIASCRPG
jgi:uncharacterized protein (TIGR03032 family)